MDLYVGQAEDEAEVVELVVDEHLHLNEIKQQSLDLQSNKYLSSHTHPPPHTHTHTHTHRERSIPGS